MAEQKAQVPRVLAMPERKAPAPASRGRTMAEQKEKAPRSRTMALNPVGAGSRVRKGKANEGGPGQHNHSSDSSFSWADNPPRKTQHNRSNEGGPARGRGQPRNDNRGEARQPPQRDRGYVRPLKAPEAQPEGLSAREASVLFMEAYAKVGGVLIEPAPTGSLEELLQRESEETPSQFLLRQKVTRALAEEGEGKTAAALIAEGHKMVNSARYGVKY